MDNITTHLTPETKDYRLIGESTSNPTTPLAQELTQKAEAIRQSRQWLADQVNFGYELNEQDYGLMTSILSNTDSDWDTEISKIEQSLMFSKRDNIPFMSAYTNLDALVEAEIGKAPVYDKTRTRDVRDSLEIGVLNLLRGDVSNKWMKEEMAETKPKYRNFAYKKEADHAKMDEYKRQMDAIDEQIQALQGNTPKSLLTKILNVTAQSFPYTLDIAAKSMAVGIGGMAVGATMAASAKLLGSTLAGAATPSEMSTLMSLAQSAYGKAATVEAWKRTADLSTGSVYYDLRQKGVEKEIAYGVASINGVIQGAIETSLGLIPAMGRTAKIAIMGEAAGASLAAKAFAGLYARGWLGGLAAGLTNILTSAGGEGLEEFLQSIADNLAEYTALTISKETDYKFDKTAGDVLKEAFTEGLAGFGSALILGVPFIIPNIKADVNYARGLRAEAQDNPSRTDFIKRHENDEPFSDMSAKEKKEYLGGVYDKNNRGIFADADTEILDTDVLDETNEDEEGIEEEGEYKAEKLKRKENGRLRVQESKKSETIDGKERRYLNIGQPDTKMRYGQIAYDVDENGDITIQSVKTRAGYSQDVTYDAVLELARRYEGHDITWNPENKYQQSVRDKLIADNTVQEGKIQRFLGNYSTEENKVASEFINNFAVKNKLNVGKAQAGVASILVQRLARSLGATVKGISNDSIQFADKDGNIRGSLSIRSGEGILPEGKKGGVSKQSIFDILRGGEAIVYVAKNGDLSTLIHEIDHVLNVTDPESSAKIVRSIKDSAQNGKLKDYINSYKDWFVRRTHLDSADAIIQDIANMSENPLEWSDSQQEIVTAFFERYLTEGRTFSPELKNIFDKIADWFRRIYRYLKQSGYLDDSIVKSFDAMMTSNPELKAKMDADIAAQTDTDMLNQDDTTPEEIAEAERQYKEIEAQYKGTSEWLKAPNGQPTHLTERQWVMVRTPNFIRWFGDWINDPQNASKVVDENGEPKVVYHGTKKRNNFDVFDPYYYRTGGAKKNKGINLYGDGFYFAEDYFEAQQYGSKVYEVFLNIKNPAPNDNLLTEENDGIRGSIPFGGTVYVAYQPTQIKSATDNIGTFSQSNPSILFQSIGEEGATALDKAEETTYRMDNLALARELEADHKNAKTIRFITGWERGKDKKWRYEIDDFKKVDPFGNIAWLSRHPNVARYLELNRKANAYVLGLSKENLTEAEQKEVDKLKNDAEVMAFSSRQSMANPDSLTLEDYIDAPELFKAYPQLRNVPVIAKKMQYTSKGAFVNAIDITDFDNDAIGRIEINKDLFDRAKQNNQEAIRKLRSTLIHEIQHAIQSIEEFARGGSVEGKFFEFFTEFRDKAREAVDKAYEILDIDNKIQELPEWKALGTVEYYDERYDELYAELEKSEEYKKLSKELKDKSEAFHKEYYYIDPFKLIESDRNRTLYDYIENTFNDKNVAFKMYQRLAGEVEARNAQTRMNMTPEERRETLLSETEDVAREDQIVLMDGLEAQMALERNTLFQTDTEYLEAVNSGDMAKAQAMVDARARETGYNSPKLYHGTRWFGWTTYKDEQHDTPFIYTSTSRSVSANYAGDDNYAGVRPIGRRYLTGDSIEDIIQNAETVYQAKLHKATDAERQAEFDRVRKEATDVANKIDELNPKTSIDTDDKVANAMAWVADLAWTIRDSGYFDEGSKWNDEIEEKRNIIKSDIEKFEEQRNILRDWYDEHRNELTTEQKKYVAYLLGYELGDMMIDAQYGLTNSLYDGDVLASDDGKLSIPSELKEAMDARHNIGAYQLYGKIGDNPFIFDADGRQFWSLKVPEIGDDTYGTDTVSKWALEHGYTSVIMKNIYDYGEKADNYVFFNPSDVKSADPVTYDDNGNVIPLSERFNEQNPSLLYQDDDFYNARQWLVDDAGEYTLDEFLSRYESYGDFNEADRQFLTDIWNEAHGIVRDERGFHIDTEGMSDTEKDNAFRTVIATDDGIRNVVKAVREIYSTIKNFTNANNGILDPDDIALLATVNAKRVAFEEGASDFFINLAKSGKELDETEIKQLRTTMENDISAYRETMEEITEDDTFSASPDYEPDIADTADDTVTMTDDEKEDDAEQIDDAELKKGIRTGEEKYEGRTEELEGELDKEIDEIQTEIDSLLDAMTEDAERLERRIGKARMSDVKAADRLQEWKERYDKLKQTIQRLQDARMEVPKSKYDKLNKMRETITGIEDSIVELKKFAEFDAYIKKSEALRKLRKKINDKQKQRKLLAKRHEYKRKLFNYLVKMPSKNVNYEEKKQIVDEIIAKVNGAMAYDNDITYNKKTYTSKEFREAVKNKEINWDDLTNYQKKRVENKSLSDWTVEELEELARQKQELTKQGRERWQAKKDAEKYMDSRIREAINSEVKKNPNYKKSPLPETKEEKMQGASLSQKLFNAFISTLRMGSIAQIIDGNRKGNAHKVLVEDNRDIKHEELMAIRKRLRPVMELMEKSGVKMEDFYNNQYTTTLSVDPISIRGIEVPVEDRTLTYNLSQLLYVLNAQKNDRNYRAYIGGDLITEQEKQELLAMARKKFDKPEDQSKWLEEALQKIGDERNRQILKTAHEVLNKYEGIEKVGEAMFGDMNNEANKDRLNEMMIEQYNEPIIMEKYYMPIKRLDFNGEDLASRLADEMYNRNAGKGMTSVEKGMTKERIDIPLYWQTRVDTDFVSLWLNSVKEQEHLIATNAYVRRLNRIFKSRAAKGLRANIESVYGKRILKDIDNHINEIANPQDMMTDRDADKIVRTMRGKLYEAYLGMKLSSFILQVITSPAPFLREVNAMKLGENILKVAMHPVETWKFITDLSPMMENRIMNPMVEDVEKEKKDYTASKGKRRFNNATAKLTELLTVADRWMVSAGWLACYEKQLEIETQNGTDPETAVQNARKYADTVVYETQPMSDRTEMASLFKQGGAAWQLLTQFQVSLNVIWNNLAYDTAYSAIKNKKLNRQQTYTVLAYMLAGLVLYGVQEGFLDDDDDKTKGEKVADIVKKLLYASSTQITSSIPLFGSEADSLLKGVATGERNNYSRKMYPALSTTVEGIGSMMGNGVNWNNVKKTAEGVGLFTGIPVSGLKEAEHIVYNRKTGEWRFYPQAVLGRRENKKKKK